MSSPSRPLVHVVGARPNFVKAAPVIRALASRGIAQLVVHTGQHHHESMSEIFFRDLGLARPDVQLKVGAGTYGRRLGRLLVALERAIHRLAPPLVVIYGDVDSTLAAALVSRRLQVPIAHVEAGLRSFDPQMPEEINRRVADMLSELLFATSPEALDNLAAEGIESARVHHVGNPMIDSLLSNLDRLDAPVARARLGLGERYAVATIHRPANVDQPLAAARVVHALSSAAALIPVVVPVHPRGRRNLYAAGLRRVVGLTVLAPLGYVDFLSLVSGAAVVITDSGGVQEETSVLGVPCLTVRPNTERPITLSHGTNRLVTLEELAEAVRSTLDNPQPRPAAPALWDGHAGERIADNIAAWLSMRA